MRLRQAIDVEPGHLTRRTFGAGCCLECGGKCRDGVSGGLRVTDQAARSMTASVGLVASVCQPSTLRMAICPEASSAPHPGYAPWGCICVMCYVHLPWPTTLLHTAAIGGDYFVVTATEPNLA